MTFDIEKYNTKLNKRISMFSLMCMNNTKWQKLFRQLSENSDLITKCFIKNIFDEVLREIQIPKIDNFSIVFNDKGINDVFISGPYEFKEIEQIIFPENWFVERNMRDQKLEPDKHKQDIYKIKAIIEEVGNFEVEIADEKLILFGYK